MAKLTAKTRNAIPGKDFAGPWELAVDGGTHSAFNCGKKLGDSF